MRRLFALAAAVAFAAPAGAAVKSQVVEYEFGGTKLKGVLYSPDGAGKRPGVLVFHEWWGLNEYAKHRAEMLADLGYVAFCADMYGDGKTTEHPMEAGQFATAVRQNVDTWLGRARAALKVLKDQPNVDGSKIGAIGYCFGGSTALQLALAGEDIAAVAAFHAGLPPVTPEKAKNVKGSILLAQGGADANIPEAKNREFEKALKDAGVKIDLEMYPGATHSYTVPGIEKRVPQFKYDEAADKKSWEQMKALFKQALGA
jgi:dienelactone hydrolase